MSSSRPRHPTPSKCWSGSADYVAYTWDVPTEDGPGDLEGWGKSGQPRIRNKSTGRPGRPSETTRPEPDPGVGERAAGTSGNFEEQRHLFLAKPFRGTLVVAVVVPSRIPPPVIIRSVPVFPFCRPSQFKLESALTFGSASIGSRVPGLGLDGRPFELAAALRFGSGFGSRLARFTVPGSGSGCVLSG